MWWDSDGRETKKHKTNNNIESISNTESTTV